MKLRVFYAFLFLVVLLLAACFGRTVTEPTQTMTAEPTQTIATADSPNLDCTVGKYLKQGRYEATGNPWGGTDKLKGWSQCIEIGAGAGESVVAKWTWDWTKSQDDPDWKDIGVKAYPQIIFGQKPGGKSTAEGLLPKRIKDLESASVTFEVLSSRSSGVANTALEMWLTDSKDPTKFAVPPITHEVMIWLESGGMVPMGDKSIERASVDGSDYDVYFAEKAGMGWRYIALVKTSPPSGEVNLNLKAVFSYLKRQGWISEDEYLASVELGNEVVSGAGETKVQSFAVSIQ